MATGKTHPDNDPIDGEGSSNNQYWFYQCASPECNFRFPAPDTIRGDCPVCHSKLEKRERSTATGITPEYQPSSEALPVSVLMDNLRSAYNVGSILRTADGAGFSHAYLCGITPTPAHPRLAKTALNAELHTSWSYHRNGVELIQEIRRQGSRIISLEITKNAEDLFQTDFEIRKEIVLVVGNEICGIDPSILDLSDQILYLPMAGIKKSLNVSVSFGIAAYFLLHQHPVKSRPPSKKTG